MVDQEPEVLLVASREDGVAIRLGQALERNGRRVSHLDGPSAARMFTIQVKLGTGVVHPSLPMFLRPSAWYCSPSSDADERFLRAEAFATFWAAAALSPAPTINRPGPKGFPGRMTSGVLAAALNLPPGEGSEVYASGPEMIREGAKSMWGEDVDFLARPISHLQPGVPLRARKVNPAALYEIVTVVGGRAFPATLDARTVEHHLTERSLALARQFQMHFAAITWAIDEQGALPVRLNSSPEEGELHYAWDEVSDALCEDLRP